ncbi:hypothetical protein [Haloglycomyces albus]|uniref:hypothetical protein n=1 Tax=Haloglycomyces albus TaxID=526067 RepID=UPI00046D47D8|nr:hypothetical protein [Haloglycomyces albus]
MTKYLLFVDRTARSRAVVPLVTEFLGDRVTVIDQNDEPFTAQSHGVLGTPVLVQPNGQHLASADMIRAWMELHQTELETKEVT